MVHSVFNILANCDEVYQQKFCDIIKKRNGRIEEIEFQDDLQISQVKSILPIHESFGFHSEVLKATSGRVLPQITFGGWEIINQNPFFEETLSKEYKEEFGTDVKMRNYAKDLVKEIRKRKGLLFDQKLIESGDKQCTQSKTR